MSFTYGMVTAIAGEIPKLDPAYQQKLQKDGYIYADDRHTVLAVLRGSQSRTLLKPDQISPHMKRAIIAIEDRRFLEHRGVDLRGIMRAAWADIRNKAVVEGGSTITQQFVKNAYVRSRRSIGRKLKEAALAWQLEQRRSKEWILTAYLNTIYFGNGAYGVEQASQTYFHHGASALTLPEAALLAGIPADPSLYDPVTHPRRARIRRALVLQKMAEQGMISARDRLVASAAPPPRPQDVGLPGTQSPKAPYFADYVKQQLIDRCGAGRVFGGGMRVTTTIDLTLQRFARAAIKKWLTNPNGPTAAFVALDPRDGSVLAMVGGHYRESQFNLAAQAERQPGSSFKPFVLAAALQQGIAPSTVFVSKPLLISLGDKYWPVRNYDNIYLGAISLENATVHSDNAVYAQLTQLVGPPAVVDTAHRLGVRSPLADYFAIGLGAEAVNPLELGRAYAGFANGGVRIDGTIMGNRPRAISEVTGCVKHAKHNLVEPHRVLTRRTAAYVNRLLQEVVSSGTGRRADLPDRPAAGKTGTTENYGDAWFVGYTPQLLAAVWVGYPHTLRPMLTEFHGDPVAGGTYPALIWKSFMEEALRYEQDEPAYFQAPLEQYVAVKRVVRRDGRLTLDNGLCRGAREIAYFAGRGPTKTAGCKPNEVEVPLVVGQTLSAAQRRLAGQPLTPVLVYKPAKPLQRVGVVLDQFPRRGRLSSYDDVTLVVAKSLHGVVPRVLGLTLREARVKLRRLDLEPRIAGFTDGRAGRIVAQAPLGGVAAKPGMVVNLVVARG